MITTRLRVPAIQALRNIGVAGFRYASLTPFEVFGFQRREVSPKFV